MAMMESAERIEKAVALEKPDRVPVVPMIDLFSSRYGGITQHEMMFDLRKADLALQKTINELGNIDGQHLSYAGMGRTSRFIFPTPPLIPGVNGFPEDQPVQYVEKSVMEPDEYSDIEDRGPLRWFLDKLKINHPELRSPTGQMNVLRIIAADSLRRRVSVHAWRKKGVESMASFNVSFTPMEFISLALRSFEDFILDLFRHPEEVKAAGRELMNPLKLLGLVLSRTSGVHRVFLGGTRTSASFISPSQFERFALPEWEELCSYYVSKGITPILHLDSDWTAFFPYLRHLPRRKCVLNLDGTSDIFRAKEVLGDHMCIMGDVPAALLKLGEPEEVTEYCRHLIRELGRDGGFILSSGCTVPVDARPDNVKAMLQSVS